MVFKFSFKYVFLFDLTFVSNVVIVKRSFNNIARNLILLPLITSLTRNHMPNTTSRIFHVARITRN